MLGAADAGSLALGAAGAAIVVATAVDLFLTVFNYDGFTFIAGRFQRALWRLLRAASRALPSSVRHPALSVGSASMLPATVALWLGFEITGFALLYDAGMGTHAFRLNGADASLGTAFYISGGGISSLTFGDVVARAPLDRALVDPETILGLATFTLALGYVVTAFGALGSLEQLHGRVRRHADEPDRPSSIIARHFRGAQPGDLPMLLASLGDDLESYDEGLRRYLVVYYFHTRRVRRSIPFVTTLGELIELLRWGLPTTEPMTQDPFFAALLDGYSTTLDRLRRSFVGPDPIRVPEPLPQAAFAEQYGARAASDESVESFRRVEERALAAADRPTRTDDDDAAYRRYRDWLPFAYRRRVVLTRVADALGYESPER